MLPRGLHAEYRTCHWLLDALDALPGAYWPLHEGTSLRYFHHDLADMTRDELRREQAWLSLRLRLDARPDPWLAERQAAIVDALRVTGVRR